MEYKMCVVFSQNLKVFAVRVISQEMSCFVIPFEDVGIGANRYL